MDKASSSASRASADLHLGAGQFAVSEGGDRAIRGSRGRIEVVKVVDGVERRLGWRVPGNIFGEVPIALGTPFPGGYRAFEPSRHPRRRASIRSCSRRRRSRNDWRAGTQSIGGLQGIAAERRRRVLIVGHRWTAAAARSAVSRATT
jgi:thioredoxin reductase (NADPH)